MDSQGFDALFSRMLTKRTASGAIAYVQEELARSRNCVDRLKRDAVRAIQFVHASPARDHLYAVAGDIIYDIPRTIQELERSLDTAAMAINKLDYEELRQVIRPDRVDELESILDEVRLQIPRRTGRIPFTGADD